MWDIITMSLRLLRCCCNVWCDMPWVGVWVEPDPKMFSVPWSKSNWEWCECLRCVLLLRVHCDVWDLHCDVWDLLRFTKSSGISLRSVLFIAIVWEFCAIFLRFYYRSKSSAISLSGSFVLFVYDFIIAAKKVDPHLKLKNLLRCLRCNI